MYAHKGIPEIRPDKIEYNVICKDNVSIRVTIYVPFGSVHTCFTFHNPFQVKKRSRSDKSGIGQTVEEEDCNKKGKSKKNKRPFQEQDDSFVPVPCMKEFRDDCLRGLHVISLSKPTKL